MKAFTDGDLERLKEESAAEDYGGHQQVTISCDDLEALINRLEAAEKVVAASKALKSAAWLKPIQQIMYGDHIPLKNYNEAVAEHEKAAGK